MNTPTTKRQKEVYDEYLSDGAVSKETAQGYVGINFPILENLQYHSAHVVQAIRLHGKPHA